MKNKRYIVVDLETTGNQAAKSDKIIQFSACIIENGQIVDQFSTFLNPEKRIPPFIKELTGISDKDVKDAPLFEDVSSIIHSLIDGSIFVAHNVSFDWTFLQKEMREAGEPPLKMKLLDTVELARIMYPTVDSYKLQDLADEFGFGHDAPHRADSDARVTAELLLFFLEKMETLPLATIRKLTTLSQHLTGYLAELFFEVEMRKEQELAPLDAKWLEYRGLVICKKDVRHASYSRADDLVFPATNEKKAALFATNHAELMPRTGQFLMMDMVMEAWQREQKALIEAGTGIGKTLGYFLPAIYFAKERQIPIVVSTYTNLLQSQMFSKDIPLLEKIAGFDVQAVVLKGRDHYINLFKFEQLLHEVDKTYDVVLTKMQLLVWLTETMTGDIDEVNLSSGGQLFWNRMKHTGWFLSPQKDPWLMHDFYLFNQKQAEVADLIIVNHALLLQDHFSSRHILPSYDYVVIDEAHHFTDAARTQQSFVFSYRRMKFFMNRFGTLDKDGLLNQLAQQFPEHHQLFDADLAIVKLEVALEELFVQLAQKLTQATKNSTELILVENVIDEELDEALFYAGEKVLLLMREVSAAIDSVLVRGKQEAEAASESDVAFLEEVYAFGMDWKHAEKQLTMMLYEKEEAMLLYIESDRNRALGSIRLRANIIQVNHTLQREFFQAKKGVVLTSATLTVDDSFDYIQEDLGLDNDVVTMQIKSPFDYEANARVLIPSDMQPVKGTPVEEYTNQLASYLSSIAKETSGRMLVLFTANDMLLKTYRKMYQDNSIEEFRILAQGVSSGSTARLTKQFMALDKAILLGTMSFWEGIDIPGDDLSCLVIVRLPFAPLEDPYTKAQIALRKKMGQNAFQHYSLPEAVLRFKQGFGRLIRRETDRGIVFVFDNRVDTTNFGKAFLHSIPTVPIVKATETELLEEVKKFFE
ncbi:ATP-dependent DNA helicase DinG [Listeria booriae]|uniref:3'-5' exonuclease DinG n=1 Tax=Listeria booriae TaxID=1552123 RepID=A0A841X090_9LIST|nr:ATP-dependent DNA helicase DinG [Listeria booriae]MBC1232857.1 ATP-dependent DNA helicase DinG [Listeria booriae]MBC1245630.1 ATP-dependent DNA helicase DinG [Listeria booriae]MBC1315724.1 ATP-dependent DNA helicase DinG [Listeria booriae]